MILVERTVEFSSLAKQTGTFWWAAGCLRAGPHDGAFQVLLALCKSGRSDQLRRRARTMLEDLGYGDQVGAADS